MYHYSENATVHVPVSCTTVTNVTVERGVFGRNLDHEQIFLFRLMRTDTSLISLCTYLVTL